MEGIFEDIDVLVIMTKLWKLMHPSLVRTVEEDECKGRNGTQENKFLLITPVLSKGVQLIKIGPGMHLGWNMMSMQSSQTSPQINT